MKRYILLYTISIKATMHKIKHDLMREIVVAICSLVIFSLFFYIFEDFLNVEVKQISLKMRNSFGLWLSWIGCILIAIMLGRKLKFEKDGEQSFIKFAKFLGESPSTLNSFWKLRILSVSLLLFIPTLSIAHFYLYPFGSINLLLTLAVMTLLAFIVFKISKTEETLALNKKNLLTSGNLPAIKSMTHWRLGLMVKRNRLTQICLLTSIAFCALVSLSAIKNAPLFVAILAAFMAGTLLITALSFQLAEDLKYSWVEKNLGVSHEAYIMTLSKVARILGATVGSLCGLSWLIPAVLSQTINFSIIQESIKIGLMVLTPTLLFPHLAFQIDARKPVVQIIAALIVSLFICTAIFVHWLSLLLIPIAIYYMEQSQHGHFYRS
ncbi:MAG: hypothetical protein R3B45_11185 [Bdellovibrionota bacterium]